MKINKGMIFLAIAFILAGSSVIAARYVSATLKPFTITFMSLVFATITALLFYGKSIFLTIRQLSKRHWKILILQSICGVFLFRIFLTFGLQYTSAAEAGIITGTSPAITAVLTWFILRDQLTKKSVMGILLTLLGVLVLQGFPFNMTAFNITHFLGNMLALGAALCESLFTTLSRKAHTDIKEKYELHPFIQSGIVSIIAMLLCFIPMLLEGQINELIKLPIDGWVALVWYGTIVTVIAFACMFAGAKYCDGYTIAAFTGLIPISSLILSWVILREAVIVNHIIGCGFIVIAIIIMSLKNKK
jgi:drug/metabolite transporter (DMT)-like permease